VLQITPRERETLQLLARGTDIGQIAGSFGLSAGEVEWHLTRLFATIGAASREEAVAVALKRGLLTSDDGTAKQ
jgi:DNA-binding CsgD family transcriptional regulator